MSEVWSLFGGPKASANESSYSQSLTTPIALEDGKTTDIKFDFDHGAFAVDFINVDLTISHTNLDDLEIHLISPDGTEVTLVDFNKQYYYDTETGWHAQFGVNSFRGEDGIGEWTIRIIDHWAEDSGSLDAATISLHGTDGDQAVNDLASDVYHYTSEVFTSLAREPGRLTLTDSDGGNDWIDAAALAADQVIHLNSGETSTVGGVAFVKIADGTSIENVVTGDGNDTIYGNDLDNKLYGMRGNDTLYGGMGNDTLSGGAGNDSLTGGAGTDHFLFDRALDASANVDVITDFSHVDDGIWLDASIFTSLATLEANGGWDASIFYSGSDISGIDAYLLYDSADGFLYYDADGSAATANAVLFATFTLGGVPLDLSFDDFTIVDSTSSSVPVAVDRADAANPVEVSTTPTSDLFGLPGSDIVGTEDSDVIYAKGEDDRIFGKGGSDILSGGGGNDYIDGGTGSDNIYGGDGNDWLIGGGSTLNLSHGPLLQAAGEIISGGNGNDFIQGSNQLNDFTFLYSGLYADDQLIGDLGDDIIYGLDGDDTILGDNNESSNVIGHLGGNDVLYGGAGSDWIEGGFGNDRIYAGTGYHNVVLGGTFGGYNPGFGVDGIDTVVFESAYEDYRITGVSSDLVLIERTTPGDVERTYIYWQSIENLEFADASFDVMARPLVFVADVVSGSDGSPDTFPDVSFTANNFEVAAQIRGAEDVTLKDVGAENGGKDRLQYVSLDQVRGDTIIESDAMEHLVLNNFGHGDITINAQASTNRTLELSYVSGTNLGDRQHIADDTAIGAILYEIGGSSTVSHMNGAGDKDYNLSFASAESLTVKSNDDTLLIKWNIPNVSVIDMRTPAWDQHMAVSDENEQGNLGTIIIETALDDGVFGAAGGSANFHFYGGSGREFVQIGNIGVGSTSNMNAGQGLAGRLEMGEGRDEVRLLGAGALNGGTIDGGTSQTGIESDVIRMSFTVASAIADISDSISNFEVVQFDVDAGSHTVSTDKFDDLLDIRILGTSGTAGDNSVVLADGSGVTFKALSTASHFGTVNLVGGSNELNLMFADKYTQAEDYVGYEEGRPDYSIDGTVHVTDATAVNILTSARVDYVPALRINVPFYPDLTLPRVNSFDFALVLDNATTVKLTGDAGWDFTLAGTDISHVTTIDASGITGKGAFGAITAFATTDQVVSFTGGAGDDTFKGGAGNDTFVGGGGFDTVVFNGNLRDYELTIVGGSLVVSGLDSGADTLTGIERIVFADVSIGASLDHQGAPYDIDLSNLIALSEMAASGTVVGNLSAADPNSGETFTYSLVDSFRGAFALDGDKLIVADGTKLDFEQRNYAYATVRVTDSTGLSFDKKFMIHVTDVDPEHFVGSDGVDEWMGGDGNDTFDGKGGNDWTDAGSGDDILTGGAGNDILQGGYGNDTAVFSGNRADYTLVKDPTYADLYHITDNRDGSPDGSDSLFLIEQLKFADGTISIADFNANSAPTDILPDEATVAENSANGTVVAALSTVDPDTGDTFTYALTDSDGGRFAIADGNKLVVADNTGLDYEASASHTVTVKVTDSAGHTLEQDIEIHLTDVNEAPKVALTNTVASISETASTATRTKVADIVLTDDALGSNRLSLVGRNSALFEIVGMALFLKAGVGLDAAQAASLDVAVVVDDDGLPGSPDASTPTYHLAVTDVAGVHMVNGSAAGETLYGTNGNDWLDGHGGTDTFKGGKGDDTYVLDSADDRVIESSGQGIDTVRSSSSHTLERNVENLVLTGGAAIDGTGNSSNNVIVGNAFANILHGGSGNDTIYGGGGNDTIYGDAGNDKIYGGIGNDKIYGGSGNDSIWGEAGNNSLYGDSGNDKIYAGNDGDAIWGGSGNDTIWGGAGNDVISGDTGNDWISGGLGTDILSGGSGKDRFVFSDVAESTVGANHDVIADFIHGQDKIDLSGIDANLGKIGDQTFLWLGTSAFSGISGELHFIDLGPDTLVQGDVDGDGHADFEINVKVGTLYASDFVL